MELIREIILAIESTPKSNAYIFNLNLPGYSEDQVSYHCQLLLDAGLIDAQLIRTGRQVL
jgi:hypothetical protein